MRMVVKGTGAKAQDAEAVPLVALVAASLRGGPGLVLDLAALLLVACGVLALMTVWRGTRRSSGGSRR